MNDGGSISSARYVGRVGALAAALGIGAAIALSPATAWAEPDTAPSEQTNTPAETAAAPEKIDSSEPAATSQATTKPEATVSVSGNAELKTDKPTTKKSRKTTSQTTTKKASATVSAQTTVKTDGPETAAAASATPAVTAKLPTATVTSVAPEADPAPVAPPLVTAIRTFLTALTAPFVGHRTGTQLEFPGLWVLAAAARRQIGSTEETESVTEPQTLSSLSLATAAAAVINQQPVIGTPTLNDPDPTTGAVTGQVVAQDPEGKKLTYALVSPPALGTLTFSSTGAFTYTPTAAQRVRAGLGPEPDAQFAITVSDGTTAKVPATVSIPIDPTPIHLLNPVATTGEPYSVAATNTRAYLANTADGTVTVVNTLDGNVVTTIDVGGSPSAVVVKADGKVAYVANSNSINVIDTATNTVTRQIALTFPPTALAITPSGGTLYVGNADGKMAKISTSSNKVSGWIANANAATAIVVSADGKKVYASTPTGIAVYTTSSWSNSAKIIAVAGNDPTAVAVSRDNKKVYVVTGGTTVQVLETTGYTVIDSFITTGPVTAATANKDGSLLLVTTQSGGLAAYDTVAHNLVTTLDTGTTARSIAASPDGMQLYIADTSALRVVSLVPTNATPVVDDPVATANATTGVVSGTTGVTDADTDPLKVTVLAAPTKGKVTFGADGTFTYTPTTTARHKAAADTAPDTDLADTFTFTVDDGRRGVVTQTIIVTIVPANKAPTFTKTMGKANSTTGVITGSVKGADGDSDKIYYDGTMSTLTGTLVVSGTGSYTYTPTVSARHAAATSSTPVTDTFSVTVDDGHGGVISVPLVFTISPKNTVPTVATVSSLTTSTYTARVNGQITVTDADHDTLTYAATAPAKGAVVLNADGSFSYTPTTQSTVASTDSFTVTVSDGHGGIRSVVVNVTVKPTAAGNTVPVAAPIPYTANLNSSTGVVTGQVFATDASSLSYYKDSTILSTVGALILNANGTYTFTPTTSARYSAWFTPQPDTYTFTVAASDGQDGIPIDVAVPISALHPDSDGTLTLTELTALSNAGLVDVNKTPSGKVIAIDGTFTVATVTDAASAAAVLNKSAGLLGASAGFADPARIETSTVAYTGDVFYRLTHVVNGVPVVGSEVVLSTDSAGRVTGLISRYDSAIKTVNTSPSAAYDTAAEANSAAKADLLSDLAGNPTQATKDAFFATLTFDTDLVVYDQDITTQPGTETRWNAPRLAWRVIVSSAADSTYPSVGVTYYVYANGTDAGDIFSEFSSAQHALAPIRSSGADLLGKTRTVSAANTGSALVLTDPTRNITTYTTDYVTSGWSGQPSIPGQDIVYTTSLGKAAVSAQANMARVFDYYTTVLGRNSFDDNGAEVVMSIDYNPSGVSAAGWRNAAWTGSELVFGDSGNTQAALDLVGHEYTHAVIQYVNGLVYLGESGALNEAYADIMGALIENKTGTSRWLFAEDASGSPYRNMEDPSDYGQPETYGGRYVDVGGDTDNSTDDFDYVHSNSGIMAFAAYKMMDATKNEVSGEQWARVFYESLYRMPSTAKMVDARYAVIASARANGFTASQITAIKSAFDSVGVTATVL